MCDLTTQILNQFKQSQGSNVDDLLQVQLGASPLSESCVNLLPCSPPPSGRQEGLGGLPLELVVLVDSSASRRHNVSREPKHLERFGSLPQALIEDLSVNPGLSTSVWGLGGGGDGPCLQGV